MNMSGTTWGIVAIVLVVVIALGVLVTLVLVAARRPYFKHPKIDQRPGDVRGGVFKGDPGSVAPRRDAPANPSDS
jgi:hypothetical protein